MANDRRIFRIALAAVIAFVGTQARSGTAVQPIATPDDRRTEERLSFQTSGPWTPRVQLDADVAMVCGIDESLPERMQSWRERGYRLHVTTGVSWGTYLDYLDGRLDGKKHADEVQTTKAARPLRHGDSKDIYSRTGHARIRRTCYFADLPVTPRIYSTSAAR